MGKVSETNFNLFINPADEKLTGWTDKTGFHLLKTPTELPINGNPQAYKSILFDQQGKNARFTLDTKNAPNNAVGGVTKLTANSTPEQLLKDPRVRAMLDVIGYSEGTGKNYGRVVFGKVLGPSDRNAPYNRALVGKTNVVVNDFRHHPNLAVHWANGQPTSSAAGRYQFLYSTYKGLNMPDFTPHSQDLAAIKLMQRRGMITPLLNNDFTTAIHKGAPEWASLPVAGGGSYYGGQGAKNINDLRGIYTNAVKRYQGTNPPPVKNPPIKNPPTTNPNPGQTLARGQHGSKVEALQDKLVRLGEMTAAQQKTGPGIFGPRTENAVKNFQNDVGVKASGRFDESTQKAMAKIFSADIKKGAKGEIVAHLQAKLVKLNYLTQAQVNTGKGIFGPKTDAALRSFQKDHQLTADGVLGPKTFHAVQTATPKKTGNTPPKSPPTDGKTYKYDRWNVYSTGSSAARLADGYEDLQPHHDYQSVNYVSRTVSLPHRLEARDVVLTHSGENNTGQKVPSPLSGKVLHAGNENDGYGNKVVVKNSKTGQIVMLGHLNSIDVKRGENIAYGQVVGRQGSTGNSTGAHVHINADPSVIKRWVADLADGKFDGVRARFDVGRRP